MCPRPAKDVSQEKLAIMQWEEKWNAMMSELEMRRFQTCGGCRLSLATCPKDVKEQMTMRLDEIGENYKNLKAKVVHDQQDRASARRTERDARAGGGGFREWQRAVTRHALEWEADGFHPKVPLDLSLARVEPCCHWPVQASTLLFFLIPKNVTSERQTSRNGCSVVFCGYLQHQRRVVFEGCVADPLQTIPAFLPGSKWSCLFLRVVLQDALSEVLKIYPPLKLRAFVDDIKLHLWRRYPAVLQAVPEVVGKLQDETRKTKN